MQHSYQGNSLRCTGNILPPLQLAADTSSITNNISSGSSFKVFARFSPLIGGPSFLPIHVEIMLWDDSSDTNNAKPTDTATAQQRTSCYDVLHRIDFIPRDATDPRTLVKLLSFQNVDGLVRHRKLVEDSIENSIVSCSIEQEDIYIVSTQRIQALLASNISAENSSVVLPLGSFAVQDKHLIGDDILGTPRCIVDIVDRQRGTDLNLLSYNCLSFAWDVLDCLGII